MSIILKGIDLPSKNQTMFVEVFPNGKCAVMKTEKGECYELTKRGEAKAVQIPEGHGRLIDADEFTEVCEILADKGGDIRIWEQAEWLAKDMPTILEAEGTDER